MTRTLEKHTFKAADRDSGNVTICQAGHKVTVPKADLRELADFLDPYRHAVVIAKLPRDASDEERKALANALLACDEGGAIIISQDLDVEFAHPPRDPDGLTKELARLVTLARDARSKGFDYDTWIREAGAALERFSAASS